MNANAFSPIASLPVNAAPLQSAASSGSAGSSAGTEGKDAFARMLDQASPPKAEGSSDSNPVKKPQAAEKDGSANKPATNENAADAAETDKDVAGKTKSASTRNSQRRAGHAEQGVKQLPGLDGDLASDPAAAAAQALVDSLAGQLRAIGDSVQRAGSGEVDPAVAAALLNALNPAPTDASPAPATAALSWDASSLALMALAGAGAAAAASSAAAAATSSAADAVSPDATTITASTRLALAQPTHGLSGPGLLADGVGTAGDSPGITSAGESPGAWATPDKHIGVGTGKVPGASGAPGVLASERAQATNAGLISSEQPTDTRLAATVAATAQPSDSMGSDGDLARTSDRVGGAGSGDMAALRERQAISRGDADSAAKLKAGREAALLLTGTANGTNNGAGVAVGDLEKMGLASLNAGSVMAQMNGARREASTAPGAASARGLPGERGTVPDTGLVGAVVRADSAALPETMGPTPRFDLRNLAAVQAAELPTTLALARAEPGLIEGSLVARLTEPFAGAGGGGISAGSPGTASSALAWVAPTPGGLNTAANAGSTDGRIAAGPGTPEFAPQLAAHITTFVRDGLQQARLELNPAAMGPLTVQIQLDGNAARVHLAAENAQTRQALEQAMPQLAGSLRESGLTLSGGGVFEQPRQPQQQQAQAGSNSSGNRQGDNGREDRSNARAGAAGGVAGLEGATAGAARRHAGVVDLIA